MISTDKQMIRIPTDPTNLTTDCIGLTSSRPRKHKGRGRPKGSKSKTKSKRRGLKRTALESHLAHTDTSYIHHPKPTPSQPPKRKKRKPNRAHREAYPHHTDEAIRCQLALERKAKNRKSAQESRERRKKQEAYLNDRLPKGLAFKALLKSNKLIQHTGKEEQEDDDDDDDGELTQMRMVLGEMVDNHAVEYDQYANAHHHKSAISDELIFDILSEYLDTNTIKRDEDEDDDDLHLETDHHPIHLQVIGEIENGIPMQMDDIPEEATPMSFKATRGRKAKNHNIKKTVHQALKTPPTLPQIVDITELPPPVFGVGSIDFNIDSESAVSLYPMPQDTMLNHYQFQSLYNVNNAPYMIKQESSHYPMYHQTHPAPHPHHEQTPSTISTNSTISQAPTHSTTMTTSTSTTHALHHDLDVDELQEKVLMSLMNPNCKAPKVNPAASPTQVASNPAAALMESPLYTAPCLNTPEQMHFIHPLPTQVPHSPIIRVSAQQDTEETKQMLMDGTGMPQDTMDIMKHSGNNGLNGRNSRNGSSLSNIKNGEHNKALDPMEEMKILSILVQIVQSFIIIICGMAMAINLSVDAMKHQYQNKINKHTEDLRILVMEFMRKRLGEEHHTVEVEEHIIRHYLPEIMENMKSHPLIPNTKTMDVSLHYQAYRQIAMEILQNMKQQAIQYQMKNMNQQQHTKEMDEEMEMEMLMIEQSVQPVPVAATCIPMKIEGDLMHLEPLDLGKGLMHQKMNLRSICSEYQMHNVPCFEEFQMNPMDYSIHSLQMQQSHAHWIKYKQILEDKCFKILLDKKRKEKTNE